MPVDVELLRSHRYFEDATSGIAETFLLPTMSGAPTVAVLSRPLRDALPAGFVVCHAFGSEQVHLSRQDTAVARTLSAAGFAALRYHGSGYGDSMAPMEDVTLSTHLEDARAAIALLAERTGVERIGVVGTRLGGSVAALTADREGLPWLVAVEPVVDGRRFMREFVRAQAIFELSEGAEDSSESGAERVHRELSEQGWADVKGFPLSSVAHDEIEAMDLAADLRRFRGSALVVSVTRSGRPSPAAVKLAGRARELGARTKEEVVQDPHAGILGQYHYETEVRADGVRQKRDVHADLSRRLGEVTVAWATQAAEA